MKWLLIVFLMAVSPVVVAYSGTFVEDFSDGNLDGWDILTMPGPHFPVADLVKIEDGYLVLDPMFGGQRHSVHLELRTGNAEEWDSYTLTYRIRFKGTPKPPAIFGFDVRRSGGGKFRIGNNTFPLDNFQQMSILVHHPQEIQVISSRPDERPFDEGLDVPPLVHISRTALRLKPLGRPIKLNRWIPIRVVANKHLFKFYFNSYLVVQYEDEKAAPGTVKFWTNGAMIVHLDDIKIWGPRIPNIGGPHSVAPEAHLVTTWGEIKNSPRR